MMIKTLFEGRRRREIQDALKQGDASSLLRSAKPKPDTKRENRAFVSYQLILGMPLRVGDDCTFRLLGIENERAIVTLENAEGLQKFYVRAGEKNGIGFRDGEDRYTGYLIANEKMVASGQTVLMVDIECARDGK
jgi:hypothetical protein